MRRLIPIDTAFRLLVGAFSLLIVLHLLILADVVPGAWLWAHRADDPQDLAALERLSLIFMVLALVLTLLRRNALQSGTRLKESAFGLWMVCLYLALNGISSISDGFQPSAVLIAPVSFALALTAGRFALDDGDDDGR